LDISRLQLREALYGYAGKERVMAHLKAGQLIRPNFRGKMFGHHTESRILRANNPNFPDENPMSYAIKVYERTGSLATLLEVTDSLTPLGVVDVRMHARPAGNDCFELTALTLIYSTFLKDVLGIESAHVERNLRERTSETT